MIFRRVLPLIVAGLVALTAAPMARALGPVDLEVAGKVGTGTTPFGPSNPLSLGFGLRGGVSFFGVYAGLSFIDYIGSGESAADGPAFSAPHTLQYGGELGYGFKVGRVTIRPLVGLGNYVESTGGGPAASNLYFEPGGAVLVSFGPLLVGLDANALVLPSVYLYTGCNGMGCTQMPVYKTETAFTMHAQVGVRF